MDSQACQEAEEAAYNLYSVMDALGRFAVACLLGQVNCPTSLSCPATRQVGLTRCACQQEAEQCVEPSSRDDTPDGRTASFMRFALRFAAPRTAPRFSPPLSSRLVAWSVFVV